MKTFPAKNINADEGFIILYENNKNIIIVKQSTFHSKTFCQNTTTMMKDSDYLLNILSCRLISK